jgi:hypothetical protein
MFNPDPYNFTLELETRNHKGTFVRDTTYKLVRIEESGWALICQDQATCHYVDPASLRALPIRVHE